MDSNRIEKISKAIIFVNKRFDGFYRYKNEFQIYPLDAAIKGVNNLHIPLIIEFSYNPQKIVYDKNKPDQVCISDFESNIVKEYLLLLTVFTQYNFYSYKSDQCWFYPLTNDSDDFNLKDFTGYNGNIKSIWGQKSFFGDINDEYVSSYKNSFSKLKIETLERENSEAYFNQYGMRLDTGQITLPKDIDSYFEGFYKFPDRKKTVFLSSASLFKSGITLRDDRSHLSIAFASLISCIETLSAYDYKNVKIKKCSECNQDKFQVNKKFREFFKYYLNEDPNLLKYVKDIYKIRSKILHEGNLFLSDTSNEDFSNILRIEHLLRLVRISLINWLIKSKQRPVTIYKANAAN